MSLSTACAKLKDKRPSTTTFPNLPDSASSLGVESGTTSRPCTHAVRPTCTSTSISDSTLSLQWRVGRVASSGSHYWLGPSPSRHGVVERATRGSVWHVAERAWCFDTGQAHHWLMVQPRACIGVACAASQRAAAERGLHRLTAGAKDDPIMPLVNLVFPRADQHALQTHTTRRCPTPSPKERFWPDPGSGPVALGFLPASLSKDMADAAPRLGLPSEISSLASLRCRWL